MPSITVKNIPGDLYALLKQRAEANHRSINSEIIVCIEQALHYQRFGNISSVDSYRLGEKARGYQTSEEDLSKAVAGGTEPDLVGARKEAFYRMVAEVVEDLLLAKAIQEGEGSEEASREEIYQILGGET